MQTAADVSLLLKLQRRVTELEKENMDLQSEMDTKEEQLQQQQTKVNSVIYFRKTQNDSVSEILSSCTGSHASLFCFLRNWKIVREF